MDGPNAEASDDGECTHELPCKTISRALAVVADPEDEREIVVVRGGPDEIYNGALNVDGLAVTLIGSGAAIRPTQSNRPVIDIMNNAHVTLYRLQISGASGTENGHGIRCSGNATVAKLAISRATVENNQSYGIDAYRCTLTLERSKVLLNRRGGVNLYLSAFAITNNFITNNGDPDSLIGGIDIQNGSSFAQQILSFNTIARNQTNVNADAKGIRCTTQTVMTATGNIVHDNLGAQASVHGNCRWTYSNIEGGVDGEGNIDAPPMFRNVNIRDFHLDGGPGVDVEGLTSDIRIDFDGDSRPQNDLFDMGADEVVSE